MQMNDKWVRQSCFIFAGDVSIANQGMSSGFYAARAAAVKRQREQHEKGRGDKSTSLSPSAFMPIVPIVPAPKTMLAALPPTRAPRPRTAVTAMKGSSSLPSAARACYGSSSRPRPFEPATAPRRGTDSAAASR